jgi:hypothetical protein
MKNRRRRVDPVMKNLIRQILAFLIALFLLFSAGGCDEKPTEWYGVREGAAVRCGALGASDKVYTCVGTDGAIYTCVQTSITYDQNRMDCAEQKGPAPAEARR